MRLLAVACLFVVLGAGCGGAEERSAPQETTGEAPSQPRPPAPAISSESLGGEQIALGDFRGRPVLINVWSSW